ncbi:hypothetical protein C3V37_06020 [Peptostreptococcaceae bacterium oral taxon 929]|nr:hypothetical protein C3V37_06020 [Peptostreptococcaceae bacterium oral taxon 929]
MITIIILYYLMVKESYKSNYKNNKKLKKHKSFFKKNLLSIAKTILETVITIILFSINLNFTKYNKQLDDLNYELNINNEPF